MNHFKVFPISETIGSFIKTTKQISEIREIR